MLSDIVHSPKFPFDSLKKRNNLSRFLSFASAPPSAARNLSIIFQDQSVIVVAWLPPLDNGGREDVVYDINCFQCDPGPRCRNKQLCGGKLEFWPVRFNNHFTHVTLTGLQPNTSYMLRVTAENGVSYLYGPSPSRNAEIQFGTRISGNYAVFFYKKLHKV